MRLRHLSPDRFLYLLILCLLPLLPSWSYAGSSLSLIPAGNGSFLLQGAGFANVAGIDLAITFDASKLSNPRLSQGALARGAVTAINRSDQGTMLVSIIGAPAINGNGTVATISFDQQGGGGGLVSVRGSVIDRLGQKQPVLLAAQGSVVPAQPATPGTPDAAAPPGANSGSDGGESAPVAGADTASVTTGSARVLGGSVALPAAEAPAAQAGEGSAQTAGQEVEAPQAASEARQNPTVAPAEKAQADPVPPEAAPAAEPTPATPVQAASVLERFRTFSGEKSAAGFIALFNQGGNSCFRQEPPVAISAPGSALALTIPRQGDNAPNFAFRGCQALSFRAGAQGWLLDVKPDPGTESAMVVMLLDGMQQCPLVVAPPADVDIDGSGKVDEADFKAYLHPKKGKDALKRRDLNGDGRLDFHDDYIFTANYLAAGKKGGSK